MLAVGSRREGLPKSQGVSLSASIRFGELVTSETINDFGVDFELNLWPKDEYTTLKGKGVSLHGYVSIGGFV